MNEDLERRLEGVMRDDRWRPPPEGGTDGRLAAVHDAHRRRRRRRAGTAVTAVVLVAAAAVAGAVVSAGGGPPARVQVTGRPPGQSGATPTAPGTSTATLTVPDVVGQSQAAASAVLARVGLKTEVDLEASAGVPAGVVVRQSPPGGSSVASGSGVTLTVSSGPATTTTGAPAVGPASNPLASPFNHCPGAPLPFDADAAANARATTVNAVPLLYKSIDTSGYTVTSVAPASDAASGGYGPIVGSLCGSATQSLTYVVQLNFPAMASQSASMSQGQLFLSRDQQGWQVWFQYH